jgi:hypothetical protein
MEPSDVSAARDSLMEGRSSTDECEVCGSPEGVLCDGCADEEREQDLARAERLAEEDRYLYGI